MGLPAGSAVKIYSTSAPTRLVVSAPNSTFLLRKTTSTKFASKKHALRRRVHCSPRLHDWLCLLQQRLQRRNCARQPLRNYDTHAWQLRKAAAHQQKQTKPKQCDNGSPDSAASRYKALFNGHKQKVEARHWLGPFTGGHANTSHSPSGDKQLPSATRTERMPCPPGCLETLAPQVLLPLLAQRPRLCNGELGHLQFL